MAARNKMSEIPSFSIVVLNYNGKQVLLKCLESLLKTEYPSFEIILVDNHSSDGSIEEIEDKFNDLSILKIIKNHEPLFYAGGNNVGIKHAKGKYLIFLNNDTEVHKDWLMNLLEVFKDTSVGAVSPKILYYSDQNIIDNIGGELDLFGFGFGRAHNFTNSKQFDLNTEVFFASGVAMAVRKDILDAIGDFDDKFIFYSEDVDLSWRIRLYGYNILSASQSKIFHKVSKTTKVFSTKKELAFHSRKNRIAMLLKNYSVVNIFLFLPVTILIYLVIFFKEAIISRDLSLAKTAVDALKWNLDNFDYIMAKRKTVQKQIRKINDGAIIKKMRKFPLLLINRF